MGVVVSSHRKGNGGGSRWGTWLPRLQLFPGIKHPVSLECSCVGAGSSRPTLPGHFCQQLLSWPRGRQGGADLAGSQGRDGPFLTALFSDNSVSDRQTLCMHRGLQATVEVKLLLCLSPVVQIGILRLTAPPCAFCGHRTGCCRAGLGSEPRAI